MYLRDRFRFKTAPGLPEKMGDDFERALAEEADRLEAGGRVVIQRSVVHRYFATIYRLEDGRALAAVKATHNGESFTVSVELYEPQSQPRPL